MKDFLHVCLQLGMIIFGGGAVTAVINWLTGWHMGLKGAEVPGDPVAALAFAVVACICAGLALWLNGKKKPCDGQQEN